MAHCALYHNPSNCTQASETITDKLLTFAATMREGKYGFRATVKVQSVKRALRHIAQRLVLDRHSNPRKALPAQQQLELPISWLLKNIETVILQQNQNWPFLCQLSPPSHKTTNGTLT
jgi:hypothetical protein